MSKSPTTIEAFPLANKPLHNGIPVIVQIDATAAFITPIRPTIQQLLQGLLLLNRLPFPFENL